MMEAILSDLRMVGMAMLLLLGSWTANAVLGMYHNMAVKLEGFDKKKLVTGLLKALAVALGTGLASVVISALPHFLTQYGIVIGDAALDTFSVVVVSGLFATAITKYLKECIAKITEILK